MASSEYAVLAAHNNAQWCNTVCAAHGTPGAFDDSTWVCQHRMPRFYPNVVTLAASGIAAQRHAVERLRVSLPGSWAVKDSFATLDLVPLGFTQLFEAQWIWRSANTQPPLVQDDHQWTRVLDADELARWEQAWNGENDDTHERIFLPSLLHNPDVAIFAARQGTRITSGVIANRTDDVVGVSNLFAPANQHEHGWAGAIATIGNIFPGLPLVGYESGDDLAMVEHFGFERTGSLRVYAC